MNIGNNITYNITEMDIPEVGSVDLTKLSKTELLTKCEQLGIKKCRSKTKNELMNLIMNKQAELSQLTDSLHEETNIEITTQPLHNSDENNFKFIDLFCGIGGFHQALKNINGKCVFASDIDETCRKTYETNYGIKPSGDITKIRVEEIPSFDVLCGGFPCQPFSKAGHQKGFDDDRGNLFFNICDIVKYHKPKYIILENVRNLASHDDGNTWTVIRENIRKLGYITYDEPVVLNVLHFNVPQNRERVVIMCKRADLGELPSLPILSKNPKQELTTFIKDIIDENASEETLTGKLHHVRVVWNKFIDLVKGNNLDMPKFPIWTDWWDNDFQDDDAFYVKYKSWIDKNREFYTENKHIFEEWLMSSRENKNWFGAVRKFEWQAGNLTPENDSLDKCLWSARGSGIRVKKCDYIPTLVAMSMIPVYGPKNRKLTPIELLRLQSFGDKFKYDEKKIYKQVGNAVNVKMIERCARFLLFNENLV